MKRRPFPSLQPAGLPYWKSSNRVWNFEDFDIDINNTKSQNFKFHGGLHH
ncbi:hypothetical protein T265_15766, partial [Opisthorchis viverrini]